MPTANAAYSESCGCQVDFIPRDQTLRVTPCDTHKGRGNVEQRRGLVARARGILQRHIEACKAMYWPCACVKRDREGNMTHVRLNSPLIKRCRKCHATNPKLDDSPNPEERA